MHYTYVGTYKFFIITSEKYIYIVAGSYAVLQYLCSIHTYDIIYVLDYLQFTNYFVL